MLARYLAALALTLALAASLPAAARVPRHGRTRHSVSAAGVSAASLYSARALRRARTILQLKLLELREERLERVRKAIERRVPIDQLLKTFPARVRATGPPIRDSETNACRKRITLAARLY